MAKIITITSGKGGVGKTSISLNMALSLAASGHRVCLFDADLGLANVNILTGIYPEFGLETVMAGEKQLRDILVQDFQGLDIIPGSTGVARMADMTPSQAGKLIQAFLDLDTYDYFIFDTSAGISAQVLAFCRACHEILLVITPEPTSLTDAYSLVKVLTRYADIPPIRVVVNQVKSAAGAKKAYTQLKRTVERFLPISLSARGIVAHDPNVPVAVASQIPFVMLFPDGPAARSVQALARKMADSGGPAGDLPLEMFWNQCLGHMMPRGKAAEKKEADAAQRKQREREDARWERMEARMVEMTRALDEMKTLLEAQQQPVSTPSSQAEMPWEILDFEAWLARRHSQAG